MTRANLSSAHILNDRRRLISTYGVYAADQKKRLMHFENVSFTVAMNMHAVLFEARGLNEIVANIEIKRPPNP